MEVGFSEMQYAYGATRELERGDWLLPPLGIPFFPTLIREAELGYDVSFNAEQFAPVFIQYKVPQKLTRKSAKEWDKFECPYFRFRVYPNNVSSQHNILVDLSEHQEFVFYASPAFVTYQEYCDHYDSKTIIDDSIFVPCHFLPRVQNDKHYIVYADSSKGFYWCSEPKQIKAFYGMEEMVDNCRRNEKQFTYLNKLLKDLEYYLKAEEIKIPENNFQNYMIYKLFTLQYLFLRNKSVSMGIIRQTRL